MGHYDDLYESDRLARVAKQRENLLRWIPEHIETMDNHQLGIVFEVCQNVDDYAGLLNIIKRVK